MTSNQLQYAMNKETERHNRATEDLQDRVNQLREQELELDSERLGVERDKLALQNEWKVRDQQITEEYNQWYSQYQSASTEHKLAIEDRLADLQAERDYWNRYYSGVTASLQKDINESNMAVNEIKAATELVKQQNSELQLTYQHKMLDYQSKQWERENELKSMQIYSSNLLREMEINTDREKFYAGMAYQWADLNWRAKKSEVELDIQAQSTASQILSNQYKNATSVIHAVNETVKSLLGGFVTFGASR